VCPYCGRSYFAMEDDFADVDFASFHWELDEDPWDNP
jgi:hypothetical protein